MNKSITKFHWISNSIDISLVGRAARHDMTINPLRAKLLRVNLNMYLHSMSFLHIDMTQVLKIIPQIR